MSTETRSNGAHQSSSEIIPPVSDSPADTAELSDRIRLFNSFFEQLYIEKDIYAHEDRIVLRWPRHLDAPADYNARLQMTNGRIYAESEGKEGDNGDRTLTQAVSIPDGEYELILMPSPSEYYVRGVRVQRNIPLSVVRSDYRLAPYGTYVERQIELLRHAVTGDDGLYSEIAKMTLAWWDRINTKKAAAAIDSVAALQEDHLSRLIALLGMAGRHRENEQFPSEIRRQLDECITAFPYCGQAYAERTGKPLDGTQRLLLSASELLAGQLYPDHTFACSEQTGKWHRQRAEDVVKGRLQRAAAIGFTDSAGHSLALLLTALSHLVDLAESQETWELAAAVMDKVLVTLALDSFQGVYGAGHIADDSAVVPSAAVPNGHASPLAGVARLMWGIGAWNWHLAAPVGLCCCQSYEQPPVIASLATQPDSAPMWASERHVFTSQPEEEQPAAEDQQALSLHKAVYKTPDYLLSCVQGFPAGQRSNSGQVWQATLGADAIVFVNHPGAEDLDKAAPEKGYWCSGLLPRVAQYEDLLIALYDLPETDPLGFTRAYFPTFAFDEHQIGNEWAFAAKGDAYIALGCSAPIALVQHGPAANRELRAKGHSVAWLCQMGRRADYESFANFRKRMLAARFNWDGFSVTYRRLQGEPVTFDRQGALCVNGEPQPPPSPNHYEGPNCVTDGWPASQMVIVHGDQALQLDLASGQ